MEASASRTLTINSVLMIKRRRDGFCAAEYLKSSHDDAWGFREEGEYGVYTDPVHMFGHLP